MRCFAIIAALTCLLGPKALAQKRLGTEPLDSGTVVRLTWSDAQRQEAMLLRSYRPPGDSLIYCSYPVAACGADPAIRKTVSTEALRALEVRTGDRAGTGAVIGGVIGLVVAVGFALPLSESANGMKHAAARKILGVAGVTALGAAIGAMAGSGSERWGPAP
ncbi:MAG TPA: hypothetical protein VFL95_04460 [Gemmatimonadales bacterium]|nr:hypothetical protein [Gemmatimonadales bacterium]